MTSSRKVDWKMVRSVAKEKGLKFKRLQKAATNARGKSTLDIKGLDPNTVYLLDNDRGRPLILPPGKLVDGILYYKKKRTPMCLADSNLSPRTYIRKHIQDGPQNCEVCFEPTGDREALTCSKCHFRTCIVCSTKNVLTEDAVAQILGGQFVTRRRCPGCRWEYDQDCRSDYHPVLDRLDMFSERQQEALLNAKRNDPLAEHQMTVWVMKHPLRYYKTGVMVELHGLKSKPNWNGQIAMIIGEGGINEKDELRWKIKLKDSGEKALLLQNNMMPTEKDVGSDGREFYNKHFPNPLGIECCGLTQEFVMQQMMRKGLINGMPH